MRDADEFLSLILASAGDGSRITQLCVRDHSDRSTPHVHVQAHVRDGAQEDSSSGWTMVEVTMDTLRAAARRCQQRCDSQPIRFHMHEDSPATQPVAEELLDCLWSCACVLSEDQAAALVTSDKGTCPVCLVDLAAGAECVCLPCDGAHILHHDCMRTWLQKASTCPMCRFELPTQAVLDRDGPALIDTLVNRSLASVDRLRQQAEEHAWLKQQATDSQLRAESTQRQLDELAEMVQCGICLEQPKQVAFQCGHRTCSCCSERLTHCHQCRASISMRIRCFD